MPKDYKNINKQTKKPGGFLSNLLSLITGLSIGLLVAFYIYLEGQQTTTASLSPPTKPATRQPKAQQPEKITDEVSLPKPKFDFYKILPNREVNISEWIAESQEKDEPDPEEPHLYIFQVGSFRDYKSADQVKAQLALVGIPADIQRVVINGQDARHRVRVGPFSDPVKLKQTRERLQENNLEFMLLQLKVEDL